MPTLLTTGDLVTAANWNSIDTTVRNGSSSSTAQDIGTIEGAHLTLTLSIPASWTTYDVDLWVSARTNMNGATGSADLSARIRRETVSGSVVQLLVQELSNAADRTNEGFAMVGFETGRTTTGTITYVLTGQLSAQNILYRMASKMMVGYAWRTS